MNRKSFRPKWSFVKSVPDGREPGQLEEPVRVRDLGERARLEVDHCKKTST
jgi:hypothetical protein